jgi:hypothetical protein
MADFFQLITMMREQMNATLSRSDVLKPLAWLIGILATATIVPLFDKPPEWLLIVLVIGLMLCVVLYSCSYIFCLLKDRDALRSEKYSLQKMAIEHGMYGDSRIGLIESDVAGPKVIEQSPHAAKPEAQK